MKKLFLIPLAAVTIASCSNDENGLNGSYSGEMETSYLSINIVTNTGGSVSRATDEDDFDQGTNGENGTNAENKVNSVRFYFFDGENAANVKRVADVGGVPTYTNYYDWTPSEDVNNYGEDENNNVTNHINATVVIESPADGSKDKYTASSIIAIINPPTSLTNQTASKSKSQLLGEINSYIAYNTNNFVMSNAVYSDLATTPSKMVETSTEGHLYPTPEAAKGNPVSIYVERVLAKVQLASGELEPETITDADQNEIVAYDTKKTYVGDDKQTHKIYVKFNNWDVTITPDQSYLIKNIDETWNNILGTDEPWSEPLRHRSYWAINPSSFNYKYKSYNDIVPTNKDIFDALNVRYPHENAGDATSTYSFIPSKVIIGGQLINEQGQPLTFAQYGFDDYLSLLDLKKALLNLVTTKYYVEVPAAEAPQGAVEAGGKYYRQLNTDDVEFVTEGSLVSPFSYDAEKTTCYTRIQLTKDKDGTPGAVSKAWYTISGSGDSKTAVTANVNTINQALLNLGHQKIWTSGYTYYYFDIMHLGTLTDNTTRRPGVVRNHLYYAKINTLLGLGTPVYDPSEEIIPQRPGVDDTYMAAEIKVLTWRLVNDEVDLVWQ